MNKSLILPQLRCYFECDLPETQVILVAGGRAPQPEWLRQVSEGHSVWGVDRGIDICQVSNLIPERLIGDGDSATSRGWTWGNSFDIPVEVHPKEKNLTDLQLALQAVGLVYGQATVVVTGVWGGRFDHAFSNIFSLKGSEEFGVRGCCAADEKEVLILLKGKDSVRIEFFNKPEIVSLLPLSAQCSGVFINDVHWPLANVELYNTLPYAISNHPNERATNITVAIERGWMGVYLCWDQNIL